MANLSIFWLKKSDFVYHNINKLPDIVKLDVIPNTLFSMHKVHILNLKNRWYRNFNCVLLTMKLEEGLQVLVSWTLRDASTHITHIFGVKFDTAFWNKIYCFAKRQRVFLAFFLHNILPQITWYPCNLGENEIQNSG